MSEESKDLQSGAAPAGDEKVKEPKAPKAKKPKAPKAEKPKASKEESDDEDPLALPEETFEAEVLGENGKKVNKEFRFRKPLFIVPTIGKMTAKQALKNEVALAILVDNGASCIEEVE